MKSYELHGVSGGEWKDWKAFFDKRLEVQSKSEEECWALLAQELVKSQIPEGSIEKMVHLNVRELNEVTKLIVYFNLLTENDTIQPLR